MDSELTAIVKQMRALAGGSWSASASAIRLWADDLEAIAARSAREVAILSAADAYRLALVNRWNDPGDSATAIMLGRAESELLDHARSGAKEIMT